MTLASVASKVRMWSLFLLMTNRCLCIYQVKGEAYNDVKLCFVPIDPPLGFAPVVCEGHFDARAMDDGKGMAICQLRPFYLCIVPQVKWT